MVRAIDEINPNSKVSKYIKDNQIGDWAKDDEGNIYLIVQFHKGVTLEEARILMKKNNIEVVSEIVTINSLVVKLSGGEKQ